MNFTDAFSNFLKLDPRTGRFILGGLALFSVASLILGSISDVGDAAKVAIYVLIFATVVTILSFITTNETMRKAICWIVIALFGAWVMGLVNSAFRLAGDPPPLPCYLTLPVELPEACIARLTTPVGRIGGEDSASLALPAPRLWLAESHIAAPVPPDEALLSGTVIYVQFTDTVPRESAAALAVALTGLGWTLSDGEAGGELVAEGPDINQVRFFHAEDRERAFALAENLYALSPHAPVDVVDFTRLGAYTPKAQLEIWLNSLELAPEPEA